MSRRFLSATVLVAAAFSGLAAGSASAATSADLQSQFAVLRHAPTAAVPAAVTQFSEAAARNGYKVDASQTRRVSGPGGGWLDVTPGDDGVCLYDEGEQVGSCAATADVLAGRLSIQLVQSRKGMKGVPTDTPRMQIGLLPDAAVSATGSGLGGAVSSSTRPNADGLYELRSDGVLGAVTMRRAGKSSLRLTGPKHSVQVPVRAQTACVGCYYDGVPPYHYWTPWTFYYGVINYGNWVTLRQIDVLPSGDPNNLCGIAQNPDYTYGAYWFCASGYGYAYHAYGGSVRRGAGAAGAPSSYAYGYVRQYYDSLA